MSGTPEHLQAVSAQTASIAAARTSLAERIQHWIGLDRAIVFTVLARGWSSMAGVVTVVLIARILTPSEQGYYYTFYSLVALQIIFELGFSFVVVQMAAHERVHLRFGPDGAVEGDTVAAARLASVLRISLKWYSVAGVLMLLGLLPAGFWFFTTHRHAAVSWQLPWCLLALTSSAAFVIDPVFSFLEGCGYVADVARRRMAQAVLGSLLAWGAMLGHLGLSAPAMVIVGQVVVGAYYLFASPMRRLLERLLAIEVGANAIRWRTEIWPFQWRIAISWLCGYFIFSIFSPVLFAFRGPVEAGRMGMSLGIVTSLQGVTFAWMNTKASPFGALIAQRDFPTLDRVFFRTLWQSTLLLASGSVALFAVVLASGRWFPRFAARLLDPPPFLCLLLAVLLMHVVICEAIYLRAHKREPYLGLSILTAVLVASSTVLCARLWGAGAVAASYLAFGGALNLALATFIFVRKRREWHDKSCRRFA